jgi:hypothetical protein
VGRAPARPGEPAEAEALWLVDTCTSRLLPVRPISGSHCLRCCPHNFPIFGALPKCRSDDIRGSPSSHVFVCVCVRACVWRGVCWTPERCGRGRGDDITGALRQVPTVCPSVRPAPAVDPTTTTDLLHALHAAAAMTSIRPHSRPTKWGGPPSHMLLRCMHARHGPRPSMFFRRGPRRRPIPGCVCRV